MTTHAEAEAYRLMCAGRFAEALPFAQQAITGQAVCVPAHGMLATILLRLGRQQDAEMVVSRALEFQMGNADACEALAHVSMQLGRHEHSNALYRRALELASDDARFWYNFASSERSFGRLSDAEAACDRAIALDKTRHASYLLRAELRVQTHDSNHVTELQSELARKDLSDSGKMFLGYAVAKELDDLHRFDEAFYWLEQASKMRRRHLVYDVAVDQRKLLRIEEAYPAASFRQPSVSRDSNRYIFIFGLPRTGTTLLEHMLLGLPGVRSNGETENFARALFAAASPNHGDEFSKAAAANQEAVAAQYQQFAGANYKEGKVIEKLPMNYLYAGAIRRALPDSKLVLVRREPLDSCFAMYRTLFGEAYPFTYDFEDLAKYYSAYSRLVSHWRGIFGDTLYEIAYEDLVKNPAQIGAGVAAYCQLEWRTEAIEVHTRSGVSFTASAAQIRRPIHGNSSGRWRNYRRHLAPLISALARLQVPLPDDV